MPRRCISRLGVDLLTSTHDSVICRERAMRAGMSRRAIEYRLSTGQWQVMLPGVYLAHHGEPSRRQMLIAAQLYAGPHSAIDAADACRWHGIQAVVVDDSMVHVVQPWGQPARSCGFVRIRRTTTVIPIVTSDRLRYVDAATAVIAAARAMRSDRAVLAALSDAIQRKVVTLDDLLSAHIRASPRNAARTDRALGFLAAGAHSAPEADVLRLVEASSMLPSPICNARVRLPNGRVISPDALFVDAGLVHETNGRSAHARQDLFEDMQERHDAMTEAGLVVLHNSPRRIALHGRQVVAQLERCYARLAGRGLPAGVEIILGGG